MIDKEPLLIDSIREILNIGIGEASNALSLLIKKKVEINIPQIKIINKDDLTEILLHDIDDIGIFISQSFKGSINGYSVLTYSKKSSSRFVSELFNRKITYSNLGDGEIAALQEIGNIILSSIVITIADIIDDKIILGIPQVVSGITNERLSKLIGGNRNTDSSILIKNAISFDNNTISGFVFVMISYDEFRLIIKKLIKK